MEEAKPVQKKEIIPETKDISVWIDTYDDLFSDFDPRPYSQRSVSLDYLKEAERHYAEAKSGKKFEFHILVPTAIRNSAIETLIKRRMKEHFKNQLKELQEDLQETRIRGAIYLIIGTALMIGSALMTIYDVGLILNLINVVTQPAAWFGMYSGFEKFLEEPRTKFRQREFQEKMANADIIFSSY